MLEVSKLHKIKKYYRHSGWQSIGQVNTVLQGQLVMQKYSQSIIHRYKRCKNHLFPSLEAIATKEDAAHTDNPYIAARKEWNFIYGDIIKAKYNWQQIALISGLANLALIVGLSTVSLQSRYIPYAVKVDSIGNTAFAGFLTKQQSLSPLIVNAWLRRYISEARSVISDPIAQKHQLDFVYKVSHGSSRAVLDNFYHVQNPFDRMKRETIDVAINTALPKSSDTWQIDWTETHRDLQGNISNKNHFEALLTVQQRKPSATDINTNPLGLYITHLSWASQQ